MLNLNFKLLALTAALCGGTCAFATDSGALLDALVRKGVLTAQESEDIRADLVRDSNVIPAIITGGGKVTDRLSIGMRMHIQYAQLGTNITGVTPVDPVDTSNFFLRRMYLTAKAGLGAHWGAQFTYDFAGGSYDDAIIQWKPNSDLNVDFGLRKVNVAFEERYTSGDIRAIERSAATRYFVESNNGRRLGAGSYRIGVHADGKVSGTPFVWSAAVTNPQRQDTFTSASDTGNSTNNNLAYFGTVGVVGKHSSGASYDIGVGASLQPDQGGFGTTNFGKGLDLKLYSIHALITKGKFMFMTEYLTSDIDQGVSAVRDASPSGFFIQPSYYLTDKLEAVVRFSYIDSDGRGVQLGDGIRSAPSGGTMDKLTEYYVGGNYYLKGQDLKFQLGLVYGKTEDTVTGGVAEADTFGLRSQLQLQF